MKPALEATGLEHVFQSVVSGDDVYRGRPDPEAYLYAAQQLGRALCALRRHWQLQPGVQLFDVVM